MKSLYRQRGISMLGWVVVLAVASLLGTMGIRLAPVYIDQMTLNSILQSVSADPEAGSKSVGQLRKDIESQFITNRVEFINPRDIKFKYERAVITVDASYERRVPFMYNIEFVVVFDNLVYEIKRG